MTLALSVVAFAVLLACPPAHSQIRADANAPGAQRATVLESANGVPLVNIQTPSAAGVSRNTFSQFDVENKGAILNNSRSNVKTDLGGWIQGNPWLATGSARVILNEVNSSNPSQLNGFVEVAGQRAEVIIANPAGIRVNGGGFINASGVTLTTGTPTMSSGSLESFRVTQGTVRVDGLGLDTTTADATRILARAIEVNAGLWAQHLTAVTGSNEVRALASGAEAAATPIAGTGAAPSYMLDVAAIGGMYAGHIFLKGTEAGLGVKNAGTLAAQQGALVLLSDGRLVNTGAVQAKGDLTVATKGAVQNAGVGAIISSQASAAVTSESDIANTNGARMVASGNLRISATEAVSNTHASQITSAGALTVTAGGALMNTDAVLAAQGAVQVTAAGVDNSRGKMASTTASLNLNVSSGALTNILGTMTSAKDVTITGGAIDNDGGLIQSGQSLAINTQGQTLRNTRSAMHESGAGGLVGGTSADITAVTLDNSVGYIGANGQLNLRVSGPIDNTDADIVSLGTLQLTAGGKLANLRGAIQSVGNALIDVGSASIDNTAGRISSQGTLNIDSGALTNGVDRGVGGVAGSNGNLTVHAGAVINGTDGFAKSNIWSGQTAKLYLASLENAGVIAGDQVTVSSTGDMINRVGASLESSQDLTITATGSALVNYGRLIANAALTAKAREITNFGSLEAAHVDIRADATVTNTPTGAISAAQSIVIDATTLRNQGLVNANESAGTSWVDLRAKTIENSGAGAIFGDRVAIAADTLSNRPAPGASAAPVIAARRQLDLGIATLSNEDGALIYSGGSMAIGGSRDDQRRVTGQATDVKNLSATIEADGSLSIATVNLLNERRNFSVDQVSVLDKTSEMSAPSWWINGRNSGGPSHITSNYRPYIYYVLDPSSIVSDTSYVTPDGNVIHKVVVNLDPTDSVFFAATGSGYAALGNRERRTIGAAGTQTLYFVGRTDGVFNPDQVSGAPDVFASGVSTVTRWETNSLSYSSAYGRCTTNCVVLVAPDDYTSPDTIIYGLRGHPTQNAGNEVARTAHQTAIEDRISSSSGAAAAIRSGGAMRLDVQSNLTNRYADILAGSDQALNASGATVVNEGQTLKRTHSFLITSHTAGYGDYTWTQAPISEILGQVGLISAVSSLTISAQSLVNTNLQRTTGLPTSGLNFLGVSLSPNAPAITVSPNALVRTAAPGQTYLLESDARFTNYRQWLGSDYLLGALNTDPSTVQKRLGDGFYEQKLIREQVAQLTGRRFLDGYANDEAQYQALMDAGVAYAKQWNLTPGVALTANQMAALTTDLVWLVERDVVLPDGTTTKALVPQVYVRKAKPGDITPAGAAILGQDVQVTVANDLVNKGGTLAGRSLSINAGRDIANIGGAMQATQTLIASAGRDVTVASPTFTTRYNGGIVTQSRTEFSDLGSMGVVGGGAGGTLMITAGRDVNLQAAVVGNSASNSASLITAGNNINLSTASVGSSQSTVHSAVNRYANSSTTEIGTAISTQGDLTLSAGNDLRARAATVDAGGALKASAARDLVIEEGRATTDSSFYVHTTKSNIISKTSSTHAEETHSDTAIAARFGGSTVTLQSGADTRLRGSSVVGDSATQIAAGGNLSIEAATNTSESSRFSETRKSGVFGSGGLGFTIGKQQQSTDQTSAQTTAAASTVGAVSGDVTLTAGNSYRQTGSDVLAPGGSVSITARDVQITEAREAQQSTTEQRFKQSGLTVAVSSPVLSAVQTVQSMAEAASNTSDDRMKALAVANAAFAVKNAASAIQAGQGVDFGGKSGQIITKRDADGRPTDSVDANAADKLGGISLSISLGSSKSSSSTAQSIETARGSVVSAAGDVSINAKGTASDLLIRGGEVSAGKDVALRADGDINLESARSTASLSGTNQSSSGSIGISVGLGATGGVGVTLSASKGRGNEAGTDTTHTNTHVTAGNTATLQSGADTTLQGAVVQANTVKAEVGGNLNLQSQQDTSDYASKSSSVGGSLTLGPAPGGSLSVGKTTINSTYASVTEQSGIKAGDGGFQVSVGQDTSLTGAVISSNQSAVEGGKNSFSTGGALTTTDIQNRAGYSADSTSIGVGTGGPAGLLGISGVGVGVGSDKGSASSTTTAGISGLAGDKSVRSTDAETGIARIFDQEKVKREIEARTKITQAFGKAASTAWGEYANKKFVDAVGSGDEEGRACWGPNGACRAGGHAVIGGLTGGGAGAVGAATSSLTAPAFSSLLSGLGVPEPMVTGLTTAYAAGMGGVLSGTAGAAGATNEAINNNALAARMILMTVEAGGAGLAQACLKSAPCVAAVGTAGVAVLKGILAAAGENGAKGPTLGEVNPSVFGGSDSALPADTYGTPPNGASPPPEGKDKETDATKTVRNQGEPNEVTVYEKNGQTVQMNTGHGMGRAHVTGDLANTGLTQAEVEGEILKDVVQNSSSLPRTANNVPIRTINVNGIDIGYRAFIGPNNRIYVSTYFPL
jgi:filamentous hemagglutinin